VLAVATASTPKVTMAPMASLNADSLMTVCATRPRILICRNIGTSVAGSVEASAAPISSATIQGSLRATCAAKPVIAAVISTPIVAITTIVIHTFFSIWRRSDAPPSNRM
jgi:hypothetical protein